MTSDQLNRSRLDTLMHSNDLPSDKEASELRNRIIERQLEIESLDNEIKRTREILDKLIESREPLQSDLDALKSIVSIVRWIPVEVLGKIFTLSCAETNGLNAVKPHFSRPPLVFGQVCARWRKVSHSMPTLWCSLSLHIMEKVTPRTQELIVEWLTRTSTLPLNISLYSHIDGGGDVILEHTLLPLANRMRALHLKLPFRHIKELLTAPFEMPLLEVLHLNRLIFEQPPWEERSVSFVKSPRLHTVILGSFEFLDQSIVALPWLQLTELRLEYKHPVGDILRLLSLATNLRKFRMGGWNLQLSDTAVLPATVVHHNLCDIDIDIIGFRDEELNQIIPFFFRHLNLPALRSATMGLCEATELMSFQDLQTRSGFALQSLSLKIRGFYDLNTTLQGLPSLVVLRLHADADVEYYMEALRYVPTDASRRLVPLVEELHFRSFQTHRSYSQAIFDLIKTRWWAGYETMRSGVTRLRYISVDTGGGYRMPAYGVFPDVLEQLQEFRREGLVVHIWE